MAGCLLLFPHPKREDGPKKTKPIQYCKVKKKKKKPFKKKINKRNGNLKKLNEYRKNEN